ncbi:CPBP family glutamic-type intramembrane protease [Bombilactobacillus thymidiniphilus]|uniref:CPBP family glutamic-type intramembrane protease n=1 Tax=Bombilactobacillus thymidiniphilus TaxID=2923363 RepID=UPI0037C1AAA2
MFGSEHFLNLYSQSFSATIIQVLQTTAMGFVFASIFVRTNNLLFPMLCHFSLDYVVTILWGMQNSSNISFGSAIGVSVFYLIVGLFILMPILTDNKLKVEK